jgi:hypothetical protein
VETIPQLEKEKSIGGVKYFIMQVHATFFAIAYFKMLNILACEIGADTSDEFCFAQEPIRFGDCPLGVDLLWRDSIQPRALERQLADQDSHAPLTLGLPVRGVNPRADFLAEVPTGVVPHPQPRLLAFGLQQLADPTEEGGRHRAHGTTVNEANQHLLRVGSKDPVTSDGLRVASSFGRVISRSRTGL